MKRLRFFFAMCGIVLGNSGCAGFIQINIPDAATALGLGPRTEVLLVNDTPLYGVVVSFDSSWNFDPGTTLMSSRRSALEHSPTLVGALFYDSPARTHLVGIATDTRWISRGRIETRTFRLSDVRFLNGSYAGYRDAYPMPYRSADREVDIPMMKYKATTWVLIANATLFDIGVKLSSADSLEVVPSGGLYWLEHENLANVRREVVVAFTCLDGDRVRGTQERRFTPGYDYPTAEVYLVEPNWFPRY